MYFLEGNVETEKTAFGEQLFLNTTTHHNNNVNNNNNNNNVVCWHLSGFTKEMEKLLPLASQENLQED